MTRFVTPRSGCGALRVVFLALLFFASPQAVRASEPLVLLIQPILREEQTRAAFAPLCEYLGKIAKRECSIRTSPNFLAYWDVIRRNQGFDLVLDAAHFTDYRIQRFGYDPLAKIPESVSFSLIVPDSNLVIDPMELVGKKVATLGTPSLGAARLNAMYPNPLRQPMIIEVNSSEEGFELLTRGRVAGAILPTPLIAQQSARGAPIFLVTTTEPAPHIALSASPRLDAALRDQLRSALVNAHKTPEGQRMLKGINFERFDPASPEIYTNQSRILKEYWGY
jgi:hypothetical protein